jgi:replication factor A1
LSFSADSSIQKNVDLPEAHQSRSWWDTTGSTQSPKNLSSGEGGGGGARSRGPNTEDRKTFGQAKADGVDKNSGRNVAVYNNVATITLVKGDGTIAYPSCPETKKKMVEIGENQWRCEATGKEYPEPQWRYCLSMKADDYTGNTWMTAFDDQAKELLGMEAGEVQKLKQQSDTVRRCRCSLLLLFNFILQFSSMCVHQCDAVV